MKAHMEHFSDRKPHGNEFVRTISESIEVFKYIYSDKDESANLYNVMYTWEYERLLPIINEFENLYHKYRDVLYVLPKEESEAEILFGKKLISAALDFINSPSY